MKQSFSLGPSLIQRFADASRYAVMSLFKRFQFPCCIIALLSLLTRQHTAQIKLASYRVSAPPGNSWIFPKIYRTWKVLENEFGPRK